MIALIQGEVVRVRGNALVVMTGGVGYAVWVTEEVVRAAQVGSQILLNTYHCIREDAVDLYGFTHEEELQLFELLISVSGVGPKTALNALSVTTEEKLRQAIAHGDAGILRHIAGIGPKTAQRIVIDLKDKVGYGEGTGAAAQQLVHDEDAVEALVALGYSASQARTAVSQVDPACDTPEKKIKAALRLIGTNLPK